jgi:spore maturation protein CgeB
VAVIGAGGRYRTPAALARGCRTLGHTAQVFDALGWKRAIGPLSRPLIKYRVEAFEPDLVLLTVDSAALGPATLARLARRYRTVFWHFDPQQPPTVKASLVARIAAVSYTTYLPLVEAFRRAGAAEAHFLPQGVDPEIDHPVTRSPGRFRCDAAFIGSGQYREREELLRAIARTTRLQIRGPGWNDAPTDLPVVGGKIVGREFARAVAGAAIVLGAHSLPEQAGFRASTSNRLWKVLGCGGFYLGPWVEAIDHFARDGEHCAWYRGTEDAVLSVRRYLADPAVRHRIAEAGRRHVLANHTYAHRLALLLSGRGYTGV